MHLVSCDDADADTDWNAEPTPLTPRPTAARGPRLSHRMPRTVAAPRTAKVCVCGPLVADARHSRSREAHDGRSSDTDPPSHVTRADRASTLATVSPAPVLAPLAVSPAPAPPPSTMPRSRLALGFHTNTRHGVDSNPSLEPAEQAGRSGSRRVVYLGSAFAGAAARPGLTWSAHASFCACDGACAYASSSTCHASVGRREGREGWRGGIQKRGVTRARSRRAGRQASAHSTEEAARRGARGYARWLL
jgi:hypothetical protein